VPALEEPVDAVAGLDGGAARARGGEDLAAAREAEIRRGEAGRMDRDADLGRGEVGAFGAGRRGELDPAARVGQELGEGLDVEVARRAESIR
jgi:hypothetical protein